MQKNLMKKYELTEDDMNQILTALFLGVKKLKSSKHIMAASALLMNGDIPIGQNDSEAE